MYGYVVDIPDKGMIRVLGRMKQDGMRFRHTTQNGAQLKIHEIFLEFLI